MPVWRSDMYLLVDIDILAGEEWNLTQPSDIANLLPGWITHNGQAHRLDFADRFDYCNHCKNRVNYEDRHRYATCIARLCNYCGDGGHIRKNCPELKKRGNDGMATASEFATAEEEFLELTKAAQTGRPPRPHRDHDHEMSFSEAPPLNYGDA
jgi:hypothetical protein